MLFNLILKIVNNCASTIPIIDFEISGFLK